MHPAFLIRAGIDWVRHRPDLKESNPYSRCEETLKAVQMLWQQQVGRTEPLLLEQAIVTAYWAEFFHAEDSTPDEREWRDGLNKRSGQYDSFDDWQDWFKKSYAKVYRDNAIWLSVLMTSWAYTHQFDVIYGEESWEFVPSLSYLPTTENVAHGAAYGHATRSDSRILARRAARLRRSRLYRRRRHPLTWAELSAWASIRSCIR